MSNIIGGYDTGVFDSSLFLLNRNDRTQEGVAGHGEELYVNVANGNLVVMHKDAFLPSQGEDYLLVRTYNSRGIWGGQDGKGWSNNSMTVELSQITNGKITLVAADTSRTRFYLDAATGNYISVDGAGAYEVISYNKAAKTYSLTRSNQTVYEFDVTGTLVASRDPNGNRMEYVYAQGKLQQLKDDQGHVITYIYANGDLVRVQDELGTVLVRYEYSQNQLVAVTDRSGHRTTYTYYTSGELKTITLPSDGDTAARTLSFEYDADRTDNTGKTRLLRWLTDAEGSRTYFEYQFNLDNFSKYNGGVTTVVTALGVSRRESNAAEFVQWRLDNGLYATWDAARYGTDAAYKAQADAITERHTVRYGYDKNGAITSVIDQAGNQTTYEYDAKENLTAIIDPNGYAVTHSDDAYWRNLRRDYGYVDAAGQGKQVGQLSAADIAALLGRYTTRFEYDSRGNLTQKTDNAGNVTTFTYTAFNKVATQTAAMGHALASSDEESIQDKREQLGYARSASALTAADRAALQALYTTTYGYDARQNLIELRSPGGDLTRYEYDSFGNLTRRIVFMDAADLLTPSKQQVTQYFYDAFGQNVRTVDAEGATTTNTYDHFGNLLSRTDGRGGVTRYTYDNDNQVLTVTDPEGHVTVNTYDAVGNRISIRDAGGHAVLYVYDRNNMLVTTIDPKEGDASGNRVTSYSYDVTGNRTCVLDAEGRATVYVYREDNRLLEVRTSAVANASGSGTTSYTARYEYDGLGNRIAVTDFNGNRSEYVYNQTGLLKRGTDASGNVTEYRYDANLNQIQIVVGAQLAAERRRVLRFSFDEEDQRIAETDAMGGTTRYARDAVGNVTAVTDANGNTQEYRFDRNNRLVTEIRPPVADPVSGILASHTVTHQYDANGNRIATTDENGHTTHFSFDKDNLLVLVEDANGIQTAYGYDSRHNRTSVAVGVQAHLDADGHVVIDAAADARVETAAYNQFNEIVSRTDGVGNALVTSDGALYSAMRQQMGYAATVAGLSAADKQALLAAYTQRFAYDKVGNTVTVTDHLGRVTRMDYDALNREVRRTDALGQQWSQRYDGNGNRVALVDALGREQHFAYDAVNRLVSQTDALGVASTQEWDNVGNLLSSTQAAGTADARTQRFEYDLDNRLTRSVDAMGAAQAYEYDAVGNRLKVIDGRGNASAYVYDARNRLVRAIDPLSFETRIEYDGVGNRVALIDARGGITRMEYDPGNRLVRLTDAEGRTSRYEYDVRGNRVTQRTAAGTAQEQVTHFEYDARGNLRAVVDGEGQRSTQDYDRAYNRIAATDGNGHTTHYAFDALNREIELTDALGAVTRWSYDAVGNLLTHTDALGRETHWAYDAGDRALSQTDALGVVTRYAYDAVGNRVELVRAAGLPEEQRTVYQYDLDNRLVSQTDALGHVTRTEYDANGNAVAGIDALGHRTAYEYDANNRVVRIVDALGQAVQYRYDGNGNRIQVIDALGHATTSYYNLDNELTLAINAEGEATAYAYDSNGNLVSGTRYGQRLSGALDPAAPPPPLAPSPADRTTHYAYDRVNRLTRTLDGEGHLMQTAYDAVGNVVSVLAHAAPQTLGAGGLAAIAVQADPKDRLTRYDYDAADRLVAETDAEGYSRTWAYDAVGNRTEQVRYLSRTDLSDPAQRQRTQYAYDALNRLVEQTSPLGVRTLMAYDGRGNRTSVTDAAGTQDERTTRYAFDAAGRLASITDALGTVTRYESDAAGRITAEIRADGLPEARRTGYAYDAVGRLTETAHADGTTLRQVYDAVGNLTARIDAAGSAAERTTSYGYDRADRLVSAVVGAGTPAALGTVYQLNAFGERIREAVADGTADARIVHNAYDHLGRLIARTDGNGIVTLNDYDAFGNRTATHVTGTTYSAGGAAVQRTETSTFEYDGRDLLIAQADGMHQRIERQYDGAGNLRLQIDGAGSAAARTTAFGYDLGNRLVAKTIDPAGLALATTYAYDARGNLVAQTNADGLTNTNRFDLLDRAVTTTDAEGFSVGFEYDRFGNQTAITTGLYLAQQGDAGYSAALAARAFAATTRVAYDAMDRKLAQTDALGTVTRYEYDGRGNRIRQIEAEGTPAQRVSAYRYDSADRLVDEVQPIGTVIHYTYTAAGERSSKTVDYGAGASYRNATTRWFYDAGGRMAFQADPVGAVTRYEYDDFGNQVRVTRGLGLDAAGRPSAADTADMRVTAYEYDAAHRVSAEVVDPSGLALRTSYEYDARDNRVAVVDANGARTQMAYDAADRMVWVRDGAGHVTTAEYNGRGLRTAETGYAHSGAGLPAGALPPASAQDRRSTASYDAAGRVIETIDARGVVTRTGYDAIGNRLSVAENATGLYGTPARTTLYAYDLANQVVRKEEPGGLVTAYGYDAVYNLVEKRVANRWLDTLNLDAAGQPTAREQVQVTQYRHDLNNRVTDEIIDPAGLNLHTAWRYDSLGNRIAEVAANGHAAAESDSAWAQQARRALGLVDGGGNALPAAQLGAAQRQAVLDAYTTRTWFDAAGRAVLTVDANGHARSAQYDAVGNLVRATVHAAPVSPGLIATLDALHPPALAASGDDRVTDLVHDKADRLTLERGPAAGQYLGQQWVEGLRAETSRVYDAVGNVLRQIDGNGNVTYQYYDGANRLIGRIDAAGYLTIFVNDAFGNAVEERLSLEQTTLSATQKEQLDLGGYVPAGEQRVIAHVFDAAGNETLTVYPASDLYENGIASSAPVQVRRGFDAFGAVLAETVKHRAGDPQPAATRYQYDAAGRLLARIDARADELATSDAPQIVALRRDLGFTGAGGAGKLAAELTPAEVAALTERHATRYAYDAQGNVREQTEGERVTTFEYDVAQRTTRVHYPATERVEVDAGGNVTTTAGYRAVALRAFDANGNVISETRPDGERIDYRFDRADRQAAALSDGVYVAYGYNFAGDLTGIHRYYNAAASLDAPPAVDAANDQVIEIAVDALGRKTAERQLGNLADGGDDRVVQYRYDANGNQVQTIDARGNASTIVYDGLNRMVGSVNRMGGITTTGYDAQGNVVSRQTGGFTAPQLRGGLRIDRVSDSGAVIEWSTDRATDGTVYVRPAGSGGAWQAFASSAGFGLDHSVRLGALASDTDYEFYIVSNDAFGYRLDSQAHPSLLHTGTGLGEVAIDGVRQVGERFEANVHFNVPAGAANVRVLVGSGAAGAIELTQASAFAATQQGDGSYSAALDYASADALFQIEWTDAQGVHRTGASAIRQQVDTRPLDVTLQAVPEAGGGYHLTISWNLAAELAAGGIDHDPQGGQEPTYAVFVGIALNAGQEPMYEQATLVDGRFTVSFSSQRDAARVIWLQYARPDGTLVSATPLQVPGLAGLDTRLQNLQFDFPDTPSGATLSVRTRPVGGGAWTALPASAINGLSANVLGLAVGGYEYEATLTQGGQTLRRASGGFTLREPASIAGLADAAHPGAVPYVLNDQALTLPGLLPVAADETVVFTLQDAQGASVPAQYTGGTLDVAALVPGSYTLHAVKTRSTTAGSPPVTTVATVNDISATLVVGPLTLGDIQAAALEGTRSLSAYALDATRGEAVHIATGGASTADHSWNYYDGNGLRLFSNEEGGAWTRYFYDSQGNVTREVRFQRRDAGGAFIDQIADEATRPGLAALMADYDAAMAAGADHVRITTRRWDAAGQLLGETEHSSAHGAVTSRYAYDRFGNKILQVTAEGLAGLENTIRTTYDAGNRAVRVETGPFQHYDETGALVNAAAVQTFGYDGRGNQSTATDARGFTVRMHYDAYNRLASQWDGQRAGQGSTLRTDHVYDAFDRLVALTATDLTGRAGQASQTTTFAWSAFDQLTSYTDALGRTTRREYDQGGNQTAEIDTAGNATRYAYDAENRLNQRTDRLGGHWSTSYDAYGQRISETDANGRVTVYVRGAFGQLLGSSTWLAGGYANLSGASSSTETQRLDWLGRLAETTDSFGKHYAYHYNDADEQIRVDDLALGKSAVYGYDALGRRVSEALLKDGLVQRSQSLTYNNQGWLSAVTADASDDFGAGARLSQRLEVGYGFDAMGNRVRVRAEDGSQGLYSYDASGRMREGRDDRAGGGADEIVSNITYDGFGNRVSETRGTTTTTYAYDAANRVTTSSAGEAWQYDAAGNITWQKNRDGSSSSSSYNAENRATITVGVDKEGKSSTSFHTYDAVGNIVNTRVEGADYGFDEVTTRDVRYLEQSKVIANSWARGARGLDGASRFEYDVNGHLTFLDRGRKQGAKENSVAVFDYDLDGQIIARADKATAHTSAEFLQGYDEDPDVTGEYDEYGNGVSTTQIVQYQLFGRTRGAIFGPIRTSANTQLQSYLYANDKPVAEGQGTQEITLKKLSLTGGVPQYGTPDPDTGVAPITGYRLTLAASDLVMGSGGQIDRAATARRIAELHYAGFIDLSQAAQAKAVAYVEAQLPADIAIGTQLSLHGYILLADANLSNVTQITDYSLRQIGADGLPAMTVQSHVVRAGDTLQSIAAMYLGSPSYWYLIADANGLTGSEPLAEGTVLNIPGRIANSANSADTFKVYNESEIIGSTSPEIRTIQKKKKWYQTLIQIVIVVIMIIAAIVVSIYAPQVASALGGGIGGVLGAAAFGAGVMAAASVVTQGLALAAGLQDSFSWKAVGQAAVGGAVSGIASVVATNTEFFGNSAAAARVAAEVGKQIVLDGRITNVAGIAAAAALGGAFRNLGTADSALRAAGNWISDNGRTFGAGMSLLESAVRGRGDNAMQWVSLATSALFDSGAVRAQILTDAGAGAGSLNWQYVAVQAVGSAIVGGHMGGSAGANYFGNAIGSGIGEHMYERQARANDPLGAFIEQQVAAQNRRDMYGLTSVGTPRLGQVSYGPRLKIADSFDFSTVEGLLADSLVSAESWVLASGPQNTASDAGNGYGQPFKPGSTTDALRQGWNREGWSVLQGGPKPFAYSLAEGSRNLLGAVTGYDAAMSAQANLKQGNYWLSAVEGAQSLLEAGTSILTLGVGSAANALRVGGMTASELTAVRATYFGSVERTSAADYLARLSSTELNALRTAGLSDVEIARHVELSGDLYLFRGTSSGWAGSPGAQATAVSATTDPYIATVFALEARGQAGQAVVQFGPKSSIGTFDVGNWMAAQEREVGVLMTARDFAARAPNTVSVDIARQVLGEMGMPKLPYTVASPSARSMLLDAAPKMTPEQVAEFIQRINKTGP